jgi:DNA-binding CsgD family transcriptional regulator
MTEIGLLERDFERRALAEALAAARDDRGGVVLIEGPAGIGKTSLLREWAEMASGEARVLTARGGELEREMPFGVVRQLLESTVAGLGETDRAELLAGAAGLAASVLNVRADQPTDRFAMLHGLYWLAANLCDWGPVALVVDDAQWADESSRQWLAYLARRLEALSLLIVLARRTDEPNDPHDPFDELAAEPTTRILRLAPLSENATVEVVGATMSGAPGPELGRACHRASGGNPFLLGELIGELRDREAASNAVTLAEIEGFTSDRLKREVGRRLQRLGPDSVALAKAVSVIGVDADLRDAAELAGLSPDRAAHALDRLVSAELLRPLRPLEFAHPLLRSAVYEELPAEARSLAHRRVADVLGRRHAPAELVAAHLLATPPAGDGFVVEQLRKAATLVAARGAPESAARYLHRALEEPPSSDERIAVVRELGTMQTRAGQRSGIERLLEARAAAADPESRAGITVELAEMLNFAGHSGEAVKLLDESLAELGEDAGSTRALVAGARSIFGRLGAGPAPDPHLTIDSLRAAIRGDTVIDRFALSALAFELASANHSRDDAVSAAERSLGDDAAYAEAVDAGRPLLMAVAVLIAAGDYEPAAQRIEVALASARRRGSLVGASASLNWRAWLHIHRGALRDAEADARPLLDLPPRGGVALVRRGGIALLIEILTERGELTAAADLIAKEKLAGSLPESVDGLQLQLARGRLLLAQRQTQEALQDFLEVGEAAKKTSVANPELLAWRSNAALAHAALRQHAAALTLANEELAAARAWGSPRALGRALRIRARVGPSDERIPVLEEATHRLEASGASLEHAHALADLGAALRRGRRRAQAREPLAEARQLAHQCGAEALEHQTLEELRAAGARPRRIMRTGIDALTPSELRAARLAAEGLTNREIAQALFVTAKTVDAHLGRAYQKLDIHSRQDLGGALNRPT